MKQKFIPLFIEFISSVGAAIPEAFLKNDPFYKAMKRASLNPKKIKAGISNLNRRGFIYPNNGHYVLTNDGKNWIKKSRLKYFRNTHPVWDRKWRIIMFDIPTIMEKERQRFRQRMRTLDCYMLHKSVFVFPYPCEEEIGLWCQELKLDGYVEVIEAEHIGSKEDYAKKHFDLL